MEVANRLSKKLDTIGQEEVKLDTACKKLLAEKKILAEIMKHSVKEFANYSVEEIEKKYIEGSPSISRIAVHPDETVSDASESIEGMNVEDVSLKDGTVFTNSHYEKVEKVYSIWICLEPPRYRRNSINMYSFSERQLVGKVREKKKNYDLVTLIMICLGDEDDENCTGVIRMLTVLLSTKLSAEEKKRILKDEFGIKMTKTMEEVSEMCDYSDVVKKRGIEEGKRIGLEDGKRIGLEQGILISIRNLMKNMNVSAENAMNILGIPEADKMLYSAKLSR